MNLGYWRSRGEGDRVSIFPNERADAAAARRLLESVSGLVGACYSELGRFEDGDREAAGRAAEVLDVARGHLETVSELLRRLR
jgi:hypothetical protein